MQNAALVEAVTSATWAALRSCEPLADHVVPILGPARRLGFRHVKQFVASTGIQIKVGDEPCYNRPPLDFIEMPEASRFLDQRSLWACCLHELMHAVEWRCGYCGCPAACELRAEIGTIIIGHRLGLECCPDQENLRRWIEDWRSLYLADLAALSRLVADTFEGVEMLCWLAKNHCTRGVIKDSRGTSDVELPARTARENHESNRRRPAITRQRPVLAKAVGAERERWAANECDFGQTVPRDQ
jgi:antirestriction protein ArdC